MKYYTFEELKQMAFSEGITGNKVTIGIWAKMKGFLKKKKQMNKLRKMKKKKKELFNSSHQRVFLGLLIF